MTVMHYFRIYHAIMAVLVTLAYLTGEAGGVHAGLGYGVAVVLLLRLASAFAGFPQLGLMRFYPHFDRLNLGNVFTHPAISRSLLAGIALCLIGVTVSGIALDRGYSRSVSKATSVELLSNATASQIDNREFRAVVDEKDTGLGDFHEGVAELLMVIVGLHVTYLFIFKRPLVRFILFVGARSRQSR